MLPQLSCLHFCQVAFLQLLLDVLQNFQVLRVVLVVPTIKESLPSPLVSAVPVMYALSGSLLLLVTLAWSFFSRVCCCAGDLFRQGLLALGFAFCLCLFLACLFMAATKPTSFLRLAFCSFVWLVFVACCPNLLLRRLGSAMGLAKVFFFPFGKELGSDCSLFGKGFSCGSPFGKGLLEAGLAAGDGSGPNILGRPWLPTETSLVLTFSFLVGLWSSLGSSASTRGEGSSLWTRGKAETSCRPGFFSINSTTSWTWKNSSGKLAGTSPEVTWEQLLPHVASSSTSPFIKGITLTRALGLQARVLEIDS